MKNKYMKLKQLKIALQMYKTSINKLNDCKNTWGIFGESTNLQMSKNSFFRLCKLLRIEPIIDSGWSSEYRYHAHIYFEGITILCIYNDNSNTFNKYGLRELEKRFKELFFDTEDKETSFQVLKKEVLETYDKKYKSKQPIYWMKSYKDFEKYLNRHKSKQESCESKYNKYLDYKKNFESLEEGTSWKEAEKERPHEDYFIPMTFKQWNKAHY